MIDTPDTFTEPGTWSQTGRHFTPIYSRPTTLRGDRSVHTSRILTLGPGTLDGWSRVDGNAKR